MKPVLCLKLMLILCWLGLPRGCFAQVDNVFGGANSAAAVAEARSAASSEAAGFLSDDDHPVVQSLRRRPPETDVEISRAILYMLRIERWDEITRYLDQLAKLPVDESIAIKMERAAGLETWFKLAANREKLSDQQRAVAQKIIDLSSGASRNPATLQQAIQALYSKELAERKRGVLAIQASGEAGLAAMLESIANSDAQPAPIMSECIITMGADGESALKAALATSDRKVFSRLILVAARIPGPQYIAELMTGIYTTELNSQPHREIVKVLSPTGQALPLPDSSQRYVLGQMESQINEYRVFRPDLSSNVTSVWRWSPDGKRLMVELDSTAGGHLERAYQLANLAFQFGPPHGVERGLATAVILERNHRLSPVLESDPEAMQRFLLPAGEWDNLEFLGSVLDAAMEAELYAAQLRTIQAIGWCLEKNPAHQSTILPRLAEIVKSSVPPLRYSSAVALSHCSDAERSFDGKLAYEQTKLEMQRLEGKALALVIGGSIELRDILSGQLSQLGVRTLGASSARETLRLIQEPQPIEYVFIVDRVLEMGLTELIQRIRVHPRTALLPLAVLTDAFGSNQRAILKDEGSQRIHYSSVTTNIDLTVALLSEMRGSSPIPAMDSVDRLVFRSFFEPVAK